MAKFSTDGSVARQDSIRETHVTVAIFLLAIAAIITVYAVSLWIDAPEP